MKQFDRKSDNSPGVREVVIAGARHNTVAQPTIKNDNTRFLLLLKVVCLRSVVVKPSIKDGMDGAHCIAVAQATISDNNNSNYVALMSS
jgi:hypothetical protein